MNDQNIIITGSNGFIGNKLVTSLIKKNNNITCFDKNQHSLFEPKSLEKLLINADIIYHLAGSTAGSGHDPGPESLINNNVKATSNLLFAVNNYCKKTPLFVNMSTIHVYDKSLKNISEDSGLSPSNVYGLTKLVQEHLVQDASTRGVINGIIFRASNIYGSGHRPNHNSVISTFCEQIRLEKKISLYANGNAEMDLIFIDDVIEILINVELFKKNNKMIFNLATGETTTIKKVVELLKDISGQTVKTELIASNALTFNVNIDRLKNVFPDKKFISLLDGLKTTYEKDNQNYQDPL